jgi:hypothetical protein
MLSGLLGEATSLSFAIYRYRKNSDNNKNTKNDKDNNNSKKTTTKIEQQEQQRQIQNQTIMSNIIPAKDRPLLKIDDECA